MNIYLNLILYQVIWFICVFYGDWGAWAGLAFLGLHLVLTDRRVADMKIMSIFVAAGLIIDTAMQHFGFLSFPASSLPIPFWLGVIWAALATLPLHGLRWMQGKHMINFIFGGLGGPLAYWGGVRLGGAEFPESIGLSLAALAVVWALFWPLAMHMASLIAVPVLPFDRARGNTNPNIS